MTQPATSITAPTNGSVNPFKLGAAPPPRSFLQKFFLRSRPDDAYRAICNRLATGPIDQVGPAQVSADLLAFGVRGKGARKLLTRIWREVVQQFVADDQVSHDEAQFLVGLRRALGLVQSELDSVEEEVVHARFDRAVAEALADDRLTLAERSRLSDLALSLRLSSDVAQRILDRARDARIDEALNAAVEDERLSPAEVADLNALARALGTSFSPDKATQRTLDRFSLLWRIENGDLPQVTVPIVLQRGEVCHAVAQAVWMEMRTRTQSIRYGGPVASIRICKGVRYRIGSVHVQRITRDEMTEIDRGTLYLTNKRIILDGQRRNMTVRLSGLIAFTPYTDGVVLEKASGTPPHIVLSDTDVEIFNAILGAVLAQS